MTLWNETRSLFFSTYGGGCAEEEDVCPKRSSVPINLIAAGLARSLLLGRCHTSPMPHTVEAGRKCSENRKSFDFNLTV